MNPGTFSIIWLFHSFRHQSRAGKGGQIFFLFLIFIKNLSGKKKRVLQGTLMGVPRQLPMLRAQFESLELKEKVKMVERRQMSKKAKVRWGFVSDKSGGRDFSRRGRGKQQLPGAVFFPFLFVCLFGGRPQKDREWFIISFGRDWKYCFHMTNAQCVHEWLRFPCIQNCPVFATGE